MTGAISLPVGHIKRVVEKKTKGRRGKRGGSAKGRGRRTRRK